MLSDGLEGCVYRIDPCYDAGDPSTTNPHAVKRKALHEAEGICVGFTEGTGKRKGMLGCLIVQLTNGVKLSVGGGKGLTDEQLKNFYNNPPYGLPVTYSYEELSTNGTPLRPQLVAVRNYE
jgi:DNA ligase-1